MKMLSLCMKIPFIGILLCTCSADIPVIYKHRSPGNLTGIPELRLRLTEIHEAYRKEHRILIRLNEDITLSSKLSAEMRLNLSNCLTDLSKIKGDPDLKNLLEYIRTPGERHRPGYTTIFLTFTGGSLYLPQENRFYVNISDHEIKAFIHRILISYSMSDGMKVFFEFFSRLTAWDALEYLITGMNDPENQISSLTFPAPGVNSLHTDGERLMVDVSTPLDEGDLLFALALHRQIHALNAVPSFFTPGISFTASLPGLTLKDAGNVEKLISWFTEDVPLWFEDETKQEVVEQISGLRFTFRPGENVLTGSAGRSRTLYLDTTTGALSRTNLYEAVRTLVLPN